MPYREAFIVPRDSVSLLVTRKDQPIFSDRTNPEAKHTGLDQGRDAVTGVVLQTLNGHLGSVDLEVAFSPDDKEVVCVARLDGADLGSCDG